MVDLKSLREMPWSRLAVLAAIAIVPAVLSYCKASHEKDESVAHARAEGDAGYRTLVESVHRLEQVVTAQQETLHLLVDRAGMAAGEPIIIENGSGAGSAGGPAAGSGAEPAPASGVQFPELPQSTAAALRQQGGPEAL